MAAAARAADAGRRAGAAAGAVKPLAPVVGVGGVVVRDGRALLVRRGKPPLYGRWVVPGGAVELGETLEEALVREIRAQHHRKIGVMAGFEEVVAGGGPSARPTFLERAKARWTTSSGSGSGS